MDGQAADGHREQTAGGKGHATVHVEDDVYAGHPGDEREVQTAIPKARHRMGGQEQAKILPLSQGRQLDIQQGADSGRGGEDATAEGRAAGIQDEARLRMDEPDVGTPEPEHHRAPEGDCELRRGHAEGQGVYDDTV